LFALVLATLVTAIDAGSARAQSAGTPAVSIRVEGEVPRPFTFGAEDFRGMPRVTVSASEHGAPPQRFEGVRLADILVRAGLEMGGALRGPRLATYVLVEAADGYRVVFAIAELDSAFTSKVVILADRMNGAPLPANALPARIVVSDESRPARWIRQVTRIRVLAAPPGDSH
jgi:DMSO/TMAO reductase YedYZ molybdopterin-dependent catalytic subunit